MAATKRKKVPVLKRLQPSVTDSDDFTESLKETRTREKPFIRGKDVRTASDEATSVITRAASYDMKAKSTLYDVYVEIEDLIKSEQFFPEIKEEMTEEFGNLLKVVNEKKSDVYDELCPIVITGETSAGKSTFINLLLGVELLPQSPLTCTSPICRISNRDFKKIILLDNNDRKESILLSANGDAPEMRKRLKECVSATEAGEKYKCVDICWPIPCLQNKIMIVDTPGIGPDNDALTHRLFEYLPVALAFIYVINPTNAGGIQSDRLQRILDEQEQRQIHGLKTVFDPRRAIFVCNKWDQMHEDEDQVFAHIKEKLSEKWTNFDCDKLYRLSAWEELQRSKEGHPITDNFKSLLKGMDDMIPACLQEKISRHANWQKYFLERLNFKLTARLTNTLRNEEEKREMARTVIRRIDEVRNSLSTIKANLIDIALEQCKKVSKKLNNHLHKEETVERLFQWSENELPNDGEIDKEIESIAEFRIKQEIKSWLRETNNCGLSEYMTEKLRKECAVVENDCIEIDKLILGRSFEGSDLGLRTPRDTANIIRSIVPSSTGGKILFFSALPPLSPFIILAGILAAPAVLGNAMKNKILDKRNVKRYNKNRTVYARQIATKMLDNVSVQTGIDKVFKQFQNEIVEQVESFCNVTVPRRINAGEKLVKRIETDLRKPILIRKQCLLLESNSKAIYGRILYTFMIYFEIFVIKAAEIKKTEGKNAFKVFVCDRWKPAFRKESKWSIDDPIDCIKLGEIHLLRNIEHQNILTSFGVSLISSTKSYVLQIYSELCDTNLSTVIFKSNESWSALKTYLSQSLEGLAFLHERGLAHGNLKPSNILLKDGIAKLGDIGESHSDDINISLYGKETDMLCFGIVLWESWYRRSCFEDFENVESYAEVRHAIEREQIPSFEAEISKKLKTIIIECWAKTPRKRPSADGLLIW